jgi:hypothetical protein
VFLLRPAYQDSENAANDVSLGGGNGSVIFIRSYEQAVICDSWRVEGWQS